MVAGSSPWGDSRRNKPFTFQVEQFPDGVHGVPLVVGENGRTIGSATVTIKDGVWSAAIQMDDAGARELGLMLDFKTVDIMMHIGGPRTMLVAQVDPNRKMNAITKAAMMKYVQETFGEGE